MQAALAQTRHQLKRKILQALLAKMASPGILQYLQNYDLPQIYTLFNRTVHECGHCITRKNSPSNQGTGQYDASISSIESPVTSEMSSTENPLDFILRAASTFITE